MLIEIKESFKAGDLVYSKYCENVDGEQFYDEIFYIQEVMTSGLFFVLHFAMIAGRISETKLPAESMLEKFKGNLKINSKNFDIHKLVNKSCENGRVIPSDGDSCVFLSICLEEGEYYRRANKSLVIWRSKGGKCNYEIIEPRISYGEGLFNATITLTNGD